MSSKVLLSSVVLRVLLILAFLSTQLIPAAAYAQDAPPLPAPDSQTQQLGSISGRISELDGTPVAGVTVTATMRPRLIVFVPGVMGTQLWQDPVCDEGEDPKKIWLNLASVANPFEFRRLILGEDGVSPFDECHPIFPNGRLTGIPGKDPLEPYEVFLNSARSAGFEVATYPGYDWRLDLRDAASKLEDWINANATETQDLYLVAHSMGGLVVREYMSEEARAQRIKHVVTVGTPYLGSPLFASRMFEGSIDPFLDKIVAGDVTRELIRSSPAILTLMPSNAFFVDNSRPYYMVGDSLLPDHVSTVQYLIDEDRIVPAALNRANQFHSQVDGFDSNFYGAGKTDIFYGTDWNIPVRFREHRCLFQIPNNTQFLGKCLDRLKLAPGDDTVPVVSAALIGLSDAARSGVRYHECSDPSDKFQKHGNLYLDTRIIEDVIRVLGGQEPRWCEGAKSSSVHQETLREIQIYGERNVRVANNQGKYTGPNENGILVEDLADVQFEFGGNGVNIIMPMGAQYNVQVLREGYQALQVYVTDFGSDGTGLMEPKAQALFDNIGGSAGDSVTLTDAGAPLAATRVTVDVGADGSAETELTPDSVLNEPAQLTDYNAPVSTFTLQGQKQPNGFYKGPVTFSITATDGSGSGVLANYYSLDGGATWSRYTTPQTLPEYAAPSLLVYSTDRAGNQEYPPQEVQLWPSRVFLPSVSGVQSNDLQNVDYPLVGARTIPINSASSVVNLLTQDSSGTATYSAVTDMYGNYTIPYIPAGSYEVIAANSLYRIAPDAVQVWVFSGKQTGDVNFSATAYNDMILVPAGNFQMGCNLGANCPFGSSFGLTTVYVDEFLIDKYEVTNSRYAKCVASGECTLPGYMYGYENPSFKNHPVGGVSRYQAAAFCDWEEKRLPTENEWEKAARGATDARIFPWGNNPPTCELVSYRNATTNDSCTENIEAVGSYPLGASPYGVLNMAGNIAEWVSDENGILRGGFISAYPYEMMVFSRWGRDPWAPLSGMGFRCAVSP